MNLGKVIYDKLTNDVDVSALVSTRIYPSHLPQNVSNPSVVYKITGNEPTNSKEGTSALDTTQVQIECYSDTYDEVEDLGAKVRTALDRFSGSNNDVEIDKIIYENEESSYEIDPGEFVKIIDFRVRVKLAGAALNDDLLLQTYSGAVAAFSVYKISNTYSGALVRIRRSSDNAEKDFYPDANDKLSLTSEDGASTALSDWISTDNGYVTTWYDQSGNSNNATQTTAGDQPLIVSSGALNTVNANASLQFDGSNNFLTLGDMSSVTSQDEITAFMIAKNNSLASQGGYFGEMTTLGAWGNILLRRESDNDLNVIWDNAKKIDTELTGLSDQKLLTIIRTYDGTDYYPHLGQNADALTTGTATTFTGSNPSDFSIGRAGEFDSNWHLNGEIQEFILYNSDQTSNRSGIVANRNTFYSIY